MDTTLAFLTKKLGMPASDFISSYETRHVPMINRLAGPENIPLVYKRRYTHRGDETRIRVRASKDGEEHAIEGPGETVDFDVVTEIAFESKDRQQAWMAALIKNGEGGRVISEDEERFLDRGGTRSHVIEEFVTCS
jgi:EthD domain